MTPTDTDLETRLTETLRAKAAQLPDPTAAFDPNVATLGAGTPAPGRSPFLVAAAVVVLVVGVALGLVLAFRDTEGKDSTNVPAGPPLNRFVARVEVQALPELKFQADEFTTKPGLNEIDFRSLGGTHSLVFADPALAGFHLSANGTGGWSRGGALLEAGKDYTIYCTVPGHRVAGMEAVIHVEG